MIAIRCLSSIKDYTRSLLALLPKGFIWGREHGSNTSKLFQGMANEFHNVNKYLCDLIDESDPYKTTLLLSEFENDLGLPNGCESPVTDQDRRDLIIKSMFSELGYNNSFYVDLANSLGIAGISIENNSLCVAGGSVAGDELGTFKQECIQIASGEAVAGDPLQRCSLIPAVFTWKVNVGLSYQGSPQAELMECYFNKYKPSFSAIEFCYI